MKVVNKIHKMLIISIALVLAYSTASAATYAVDTAHTSVGFTVRHLMISNVSGKFDVFDGQIEIDEDKKELVSVKATADVNSINTNQPKRDGHLKSADFFDVANFPTITFESTKVERTGANDYKVTGNLTIHGQTRSVIFTGQMTGLVDAGNFGGKKAGFWATTIIDRKDFGLIWNKNLDAGGVVVGERVKIKLEVEANYSS